MVEANGIKYFAKVYQRDDTMPNLIFLHGFMGSGEVFDGLIKLLKPFCNPITIDLLGHGQTEHAVSIQQFKTENQVKGLAEIISITVGSPCFLYGYSMGGRLALQFAAAYPKMLKGLILESTNPGLTTHKERQERQRIDEGRAQSIQNDFNAFLNNWEQLPLFEKSFANPEALNRYHQIQKQNNARQMAMCLRGFGTGQMPAINFAAITLPVLLLSGFHDEKHVNSMRIMSRENSNNIFHVVSNAGHRVHLDCPNQVSKHIQKFLNSL